MSRPAQTLIASLLAIFIAFIIAFTALITSPQNIQSETIELAISSLNETIKGCFAYTLDKRWEHLTRREQTNKETKTEDVEQKTKELFDSCIELTKSYIERLYKVKIDFSTDLKTKNYTNSYNVITFILKNKDSIRINFQRNISININKVEIKETYTFKTLSINFSTNGFISSYVKTEVYFIEDNLYKKVIEFYSLPVDFIKKCYIIEVGIEPKYLVKNRDMNEEKKLVFLVRVFDYDGASVWLKEEVSV